MARLGGGIGNNFAEKQYVPDLPAGSIWMCLLVRSLLFHKVLGISDALASFVLCQGNLM